jgi:hypothetical protein
MKHQREALFKTYEELYDFVELHHEIGIDEYQYRELEKLVKELGRKLITFNSSVK